jgi:hypothetical protein
VRVMWYGYERIRRPCLSCWFNFQSWFNFLSFFCCSSPVYNSLCPSHVPSESRSFRDSASSVFCQQLDSRVWVWDWIHSHTPPRTRSPSSRHPPFTHYPFPPRSLVCGGQASPHMPRLVVSHSTCPPLSSSPHAHSFVLGTAVINTHSRGQAAKGAGTGNVKGLGVPGHIVLHADDFILTSIRIMETLMLTIGLGAGNPAPHCPGQNSWQPRGRLRV